MTYSINPRVSLERIRSHIGILEGVRHPVAAPEALEDAADYISGYLGALGYQLREHRFRNDGRLFRNVVATRYGLSRERVALLAHYDTVAGSPGADDNASGVAVLLEVAAVLAGIDLERTVQFIGVSLEENAREHDPQSGTNGSRALANHAVDKGWDLKGVVVLESVAYAGKDAIQTAPGGVPGSVPEVGDFIAVVGNERSKELVERFARGVEREGINLPHIPLVVPGNGEVLPDTRRSDHAPFWDAGFPAIMLTDTTNFRNPHYHRQTDTLSTLNLEFATRVCSATFRFMVDMARRVRAK